MTARVFQPNDRCGKYEIMRLIGAGGMGEVYLAYDRLMHRYVALKMLPLRKSSEPDFRDRMVREAYTGSRVEHHNLVRVHDLGMTDDGVLYLVMEYLEGLKTLRDMIFQAGPFDATVALPWLIQMAQGMAALHGAAILHRDLKPENVGLVPPGVVKIIDFGLARVRTHALRTTALPTDKNPKTLGTVHYMAPEQIFGGAEVSDKIDVYSLGLIAAEMLTGRHAFQLSTEEFPTETEVTIRKAHASPIRVGDYANVPDVLSDLVARCLAMQPEERPSAAELVRGFKAVLDGLQIVGAARSQIAAQAAMPSRLPVQPPVSVQAREPSSPTSKPRPVLKTERLPVGFRPADPRPTTPEPPRSAAAARQVAPVFTPTTEFPAPGPGPMPSVNASAPQIRRPAPDDRMSQPTPGPVVGGSAPVNRKQALGVLAGFVAVMLIGLPISIAVSRQHASSGASSSSADSLPSASVSPPPPPPASAANTELTPPTPEPPAAPSGAASTAAPPPAAPHTATPTVTSTPKPTAEVAKVAPSARPKTAPSGGVLPIFDDDPAPRATGLPSPKQSAAPKGEVLPKSDL